MLLSMGAATEKRCMGYTALIIAVREGHNQVVRTLLNEGKTTIDKAGPKGVTALMYACSLGHHQLVQLLLDNGADPLVMDNLGYRASDFAKGKWPDVTAVIEEFGYKGPCSWICQKWLQQVCSCVFKNQATNAFPEPCSELEETYRDEPSDDTLRPRGSISNRVSSQEQNPRMSMGPTSKRGSRRGSGSVTREDVSAAARRYGEPEDDDNKSQNSADSDTPLVDRYPNALADKEPTDGKRLSMDQAAEQDSGAPSEDVGIKYDPDIKYDSEDDAALGTANSTEPGAHVAMPSMGPSRESAPPSQTPSQTMDC